MFLDVEMIHTWIKYELLHHLSSKLHKVFRHTGEAHVLLQEKSYPEISQEVICCHCCFIWTV